MQDARKSIIFSSVIAIFSIGLLCRCSDTSNDDGKINLNGKWIYEDNCGNSLEVWFHGDSLLWYAHPLNELYRLEFSVEKDSLYFVDTPYPTTGELIVYDDYFWLSPYPDLVYPFSRLEDQVDSLNFASVQRNEFLKRHSK